MSRLNIINIETGKEWTEENTNHSWTEFALELVKRHPEMGIVYCDIEGIVQMDGMWYILDECNHWEYIPSDEYRVEEIEEETK